MTLSSIAALFSAMFVLALIPGPSIFAVVARSIASGFTHSFVTVLGIVVGDLIFIILAIYGWFIAETISGLFVLMKYLGSAYLIWLGITLWRLPIHSIEIQEITELSWLSNFLGGLLITLSDPKAILFYVSFLPAFLELSHVSILDTGIIMVIAIIAVGGAKLGYAYMADQSRLFLTSARAKQGINVIAGSVMISTGIFLIAKT